MSSHRDAVSSAMEEIFRTMPGDWDVVEPKALQEALKSKQRPIVLDVRSPQEFADGHIDGAVNIPVRDLPRRMEELSGDRDAPIVVLCQSGIRSTYGAMYLRALGFTNVKNLHYGMAGWRAEGLPVVRP